MLQIVMLLVMVSMTLILLFFFKSFCCYCWCIGALLFRRRLSRRLVRRRYRYGYVFVLIRISLWWMLEAIKTRQNVRKAECEEEARNARRVIRKKGKTRSQGHRIRLDKIVCVKRCTLEAYDPMRYCWRNDVYLAVCILPDERAYKCPDCCQLS